MGVILNNIIDTTGCVILQKKNVTMLDPEEKVIVKDVADVGKQFILKKIVLNFKNGQNIILNVYDIRYED
jgi:hypothetical protein